MMLVHLDFDEINKKNEKYVLEVVGSSNLLTLVAGEISMLY
jgi:hypothetical protein